MMKNIYFNCFFLLFLAVTLLNLSACTQTKSNNPAKSREHIVSNEEACKSETFPEIDQMLAKYKLKTGFGGHVGMNDKIYCLPMITWVEKPEDIEMCNKIVDEAKKELHMYNIKGHSWETCEYIFSNP